MYIPTEGLSRKSMDASLDSPGVGFRVFADKRITEDPQVGGGGEGEGGRNVGTHPCEA